MECSAAINAGLDLLWPALRYGAGASLSRTTSILRLGGSVRFGVYNYVAASDSAIHIGWRLLCSPFVSIIALNHSIVDGVVI
jgi:hypothetical protein